MNQSVMLLLWFVIGSLIGALSYGFCRWMQWVLRGTKTFEQYVVLFWLVGFPLSLSLLQRVPFLLNPLLILAWCLIGAYVHGKSIDYKSHSFISFSLIVASCVISTVMGWYLTGFLAFGRIGNVPIFGPLFTWLYSFGLLGYPVLTPLAICVWRTMPVRRGVDVPFEDASG